MDDDKTVKLPCMDRQELRTVLLALKVAQVRYGFLLMAADQVGLGPPLSQDDLATLIRDLDHCYREAANDI